METIILAVIFCIAAGYIGKKIYKSITGKGGSCGSCSGKSCGSDCDHHN